MKKEKRSLRARRSNIVNFEIINFDKDANHRVDRRVNKHSRNSRDKEQYRDDRRRLVIDSYHNQKHEYSHDYTRQDHKFNRENVYEHENHRHRYSKNFKFNYKHDDRVKKENKDRRHRNNRFKNKSERRDCRYDDERIFKNSRSKYKKKIISLRIELNSKNDAFT